MGFCQALRLKPTVAAIDVNRSYELLTFVVIAVVAFIAMGSLSYL